MRPSLGTAVSFAQQPEIFTLATTTAPGIAIIGGRNGQNSHAGVGLSWGPWSLAKGDFRLRFASGPLAAIYDLSPDWCYGPWHDYAADMAAVTTLLVVAPAPARAQLFDDLFPFFQRNNRRGWFAPPEREERAPDYSKAPAPKKTDAVPQTQIMVFGDSMADWLAYGLEQAYTDTPEIGILRRHRTLSGLIRIEARNDPRGEYPDWPLAAKEMIAAQKPKFVVMMIGMNDRRQIKEAPQAVRAKPVASANPDANDPAARELDTPEPAAAAAPEPPARGTKTFEFGTDGWSEAYIRRIDDTIAALKTSGVPIFWVGLPQLRGQRTAADIPFLNDLYRSRADKGGIVYVDVWDGFVDEDGRFTQSGPDFEGQTRRLRSGDGVYFTQAGARKLAHFVEREIERWLSARAVTVALPVEDPKAEAPAASEVAPAAASGKAGLFKARPLSGPTVPLIAEASSESEELLGGKPRPAVTDAVASKVLVKGEAMPVPAGRADDFAWPRRTVAPCGKDPVVATTDLPMTPMVAERGSAPAAAAPAESAAVAAAAPAASQPRRVRAAEYQQNFFHRQQFNFFPFLFGGR
jgi:uncharacterized protein